MSKAACRVSRPADWRAASSSACFMTRPMKMPDWPIIFTPFPSAGSGWKRSLTANSSRRVSFPRRGPDPAQSAARPPPIRRPRCALHGEGCASARPRWNTATPFRKPLQLREKCPAWPSAKRRIRSCAPCRSAGGPPAFLSSSSPQGAPSFWRQHGQPGTTSARASGGQLRPIHVSGKPLGNKRDKEENRKQTRQIIPAIPGRKGPDPDSTRPRQHPHVREAVAMVFKAGFPPALQPPLLLTFCPFVQNLPLQALRASA